MDSIFGLGEAQRAAFFHHMLHSFRPTYICLWSYSPLPSNCLKFLDGIFQEESNLQQASSSSGSYARRLFEDYCRILHYVDLGYVPGFCFKNNLPFMETNLDYLQTIAHNEMQLQFYQGAGIKTVVFMGCAVGEIELGFSSTPQANLEMEMRNWFPVDFSRQTHGEDLTHFTNQTLIPTSSSSLSLDSFEMNSSSSPSSLFNIPTTSTTFMTTLSHPMLETNPNLHHALTLIRNNQEESDEDGAMTRAILAVLSSSTSSSSSSHNTPPISHGRAAFTRYQAAASGPAKAPTKRRNLLGRAVLFYRELSMRRSAQEGHMQTPTQMHHVIQERRRREKLNESFQVLKTLLPPLSKRDKASVLSSTTEYLTSLKSQVEELKKRNQTLETQLRREMGEDEELGLSITGERVVVEMERVSTSTLISGERSYLLDLRVRLRSGECRLLDLVSEVLKTLQQYQTNVTILSMQSNTRMLQQESTPFHALILRLKVEGNGFDEGGVQETLRQVVGNLPQ